VAAQKPPPCWGDKALKALPSLRKLVRKIKHEIDLDLVDVIDLISNYAFRR